MCPAGGTRMRTLRQAGSAYQRTEAYSARWAFEDRWIQVEERIAASVMAIR
jgi:hypothetical protein